MRTQSARASRHLLVFGLATAGLVAAIIATYAAVHGQMHLFSASVPLDPPPKWVVVSLIIFLAAIVSSIVGFAFSAIAGALILHYVANGVEAVQIMMSASIGIQAYCVAGLWRSIRWSRCVPFIVGGIAALPLGIVLLLNLQPGSYVLTLGAMLIAYGLYMLVRRPALTKGGDRPGLDALVGALGGITGPLAALPGIWVTISCGRRGWDKVAQRAVYQPYILVMQIAGLGALCLLQRQSAPDPALLAYALPGVAGAVMGLRVFHALGDVQFQRLINLALIASGSALLFK